MRARLKAGESLGDRVLKVDHAGEHGAVCIYRAQRLVARWRCPGLVDELTEFLTHEQRHRALFAQELKRRGRRRCRSYAFCALGGWSLGLVTGVLGPKAIAATTLAIEQVVLRHLVHQMVALSGDQDAQAIISDIIDEEREHMHRASQHGTDGLWASVIRPVVAVSTEAVIWLGMRL